jgi:hypothetical protein
VKYFINLVGGEVPQKAYSWRDVCSRFAMRNVKPLEERNQFILYSGVRIAFVVERIE